MGQTTSIDTPEEEFYRPRTPLRFGSVPTALPVDPREYNIRERGCSVSGASVSSFNDVFPAILSQESFLDGFDDDCGSPFSLSTASGQSFSDCHEGSKGSPTTTSQEGTHFCKHNGCEFASTGFQTEEELKDHNCSANHSSSANTPAEDEFADGIPFYFLPTLCIEDEVTPPRSTVLSNALGTKSQRTRPQQPPRPLEAPPNVKRRKVTPPPPSPAATAAAASSHGLPSPPPSRSTNPPRRRASKPKFVRSSTPILQQPHHPATQCECPQCQRRASSAYLPATQYATTAPGQPPPRSPASPPATKFQAPLWQMPATLAAEAATGMQVLPTQYEWQQLPHVQQQLLVSSQVGQQGGVIWDVPPPNDFTYGVY